MAPKTPILRDCIECGKPTPKVTPEPICTFCWHRFYDVETD
jgi:hypothetical protein